MKTSKNNVNKASLGLFFFQFLRYSQRSKKLHALIQAMHLTSLAAFAIGRLNTLPASKSDSLRVSFLGEKLVSPNEWRQLRGRHERNEVSEIETAFFPLPSQTAPYATVITSLYKSEAYLESFITTVLSQTIFNNCEVVVILVSSSALEKTLLKNAFSTFGNVKLIEITNRIGIYEAWNLAIRESSAELITNMNADDQRHPRSLEIQVSYLFSQHADVVYQDVYYSLESNLTWDEISSAGVKSDLPEVTTARLAQGFNYPHNAPMWRRSLHEKVGVFDESFKSAGDHDFWIRASEKGATFLKLQELHVGYFINPTGVSTQPNSPGITEGAQILRKYRRLARSKKS